MANSNRNDRDNMRPVMCTFECPAGVGGMANSNRNDRDNMRRVMCTFECPAGVGGMDQYV